jgi:hypothetical protein
VGAPRALLPPALCPQHRAFRHLALHASTLPDELWIARECLALLPVTGDVADLARVVLEVYLVLGVMLAVALHEARELADVVEEAGAKTPAR